MQYGETFMAFSVLVRNEGWVTPLNLVQIQYQYLNNDTDAATDTLFVPLSPLIYLYLK